VATLLAFLLGLAGGLAGALPLGQQHPRDNNLSTGIGEQEGDKAGQKGLYEKVSELITTGRGAETANVYPST
jgi:hypothetical protein